MYERQDLPRIPNVARRTEHEREMLTLPSMNGAPGRVAAYMEPSLCIERRDEDAGAPDRTAIGAMKAVEDAMRVATAPTNIWLATILLNEVVVRVLDVLWCGGVVWRASVRVVVEVGWYNKYPASICSTGCEPGVAD